jgi:putative Holliday junction resolvase
VIVDQFPKQDTISALAFDYGTQRIGVAFGQSVSGSAKAVCVIKAKDGIPDWHDIEKLLEEWRPDIAVVGLPYNMDGSESELLIRAIKFSKRLNGRFGLPCYGMDERLSSKEAAQQVLNVSSGTKKIAAIDDIAAQIILENWFSEFDRSKSASKD